MWRSDFGNGQLSFKPAILRARGICPVNWNPHLRCGALSLPRKQRDRTLPRGRFYLTAGRARRAGAELGLRAKSVGGFSATAALTYARNTYTQYLVDSVHYERPGAFADFSGNGTWEYLASSLAFRSRLSSPPEDPSIAARSRGKLRLLR
jgi:hypothetical protein